MNLSENNDTSRERKNRNEVVQVYNKLDLAIELTVGYSKKYEIVYGVLDYLNSNNYNFYRTGEMDTDAEKIHRISSKIQGKKGISSRRIKKVLMMISHLDKITIQDMFAIQERVLKGKKQEETGYRNHDLSLEVSAPHFKIPALMKYIFPVNTFDTQELLNFYRRAMTIAPLSEHNETVFGIIVSHMYNRDGLQGIMQ